MEISDLNLEQHGKFKAAKVFNFYGYLYLPDDSFIKIINDSYIIEIDGNYSLIEKDYFEALLDKHDILEIPDEKESFSFT